jgi:hypothetical protein
LGSLFLALPSTAEEESQVTFESIGSAISFLHYFCMKFTFTVILILLAEKEPAGAEIDGKWKYVTH